MAFNVSYNFVANDQFSAVSKKITKATQKIKKSIGGVSKNLKSIDIGNKKTGKSLAVISNKLKIADASFKNTGKSIAIIPKKLIPVNSSLNKTGKELAILPGRFRSFESESSRTFKNIAKIPRVNRSVIQSFKKILSVGKRVFAGINASVSKFIRKLKKMRKTAKGAGAGVKNSLKNLVVGAGIFLGIKKATSVGADFQDSLIDLSIITGATGKDLKLLSDETLRLSKSSIVAQTEVAEAIKIIGSQKSELLKNIPALIATTEQVLILKNAAGIELSKAAEITTTSLNIFGKAASEAGKFVDILAAGAVVGASEIGDTGEAIIIAGGAARAAGLSFKDLNVLLQVVSKGGFKASRAGTALSSILGRLEKGVESIGLKGIDFRKQDLQTVFLKLKKQIEGIPDPAIRAKVAMDIFGEEHKKVGFALLNNAFLINEFSKAMDESGLALKQAKARLLSLNKQTELAGIIIKDKLIVAFDILGPALLGIVTGFNTLSPKIQNIISVSVAAVVGFGALLLVIAGISAIAPFLAAGLAGIGAALAVLISPIGLIVIGVAAAIAVGILLFKNWDKVKEIIGAAVFFIIEKIKQFGDFLLSFPGIAAFVGALGAIKDAVFGIGRFFFEVFTGIGVFIGQKVADIVISFTNAFNDILSAISPFTDSIFAAFTNIGNFIKEIFSAYVDFIFSLFDTVTKKITSFFNVISDIANAIGSFFGNAADDVKESFDEINKTVKVEKTITNISKANLANVIPITNKIKISAPEVVKLNTPVVKLAQPEITLPTPSPSPTVTNIEESKATVNINIKAPRGVVENIKVDDVGSRGRLNVGFNMKEAGVS